VKYLDPLKHILSLTRPYWDRTENRRAVRWAFLKALQCRTAALGGETYRSEGYEVTFYHPCKSRHCSSCGYRATVQWCRERWAALPDVLYKGITFTMPDVLWPFFRDNPHLAKVLPVLAAKTIQMRLRAKYGLRVGVLAVLHTFNGKLEFNSHVHVMATAGGLSESGTWIRSVYYDRDRLLEAWQKAVIGLLRATLQAGQLRTGMNIDEVNGMLVEQAKRWWSIKIQSFKSKEHFLKYAGRYTRRPPIARRRITYVGERMVRFWYKDKKLCRRVYVQCSLEEFIDRWTHHIPERYQHAPRSFGLFAPRSLGQTSSAVFAILGQVRRPRPKPRRWAESVKRDFGRDPLLDPTGKRMKWLRRLAPTYHGAETK
jgi:hypothetical protein